MFSYSGRNTILYSLRYEFNLSDILHNYQCKRCEDQCSERISDDYIICILRDYVIT